MATGKKNTNGNVEQVEDGAKQMDVNNTVTQTEFSDSRVLDIISLNNELSSMNKGELRFTVLKKGEYVFDKTNKDGNPILNRDTGEVEQIKSPYVEITGEGVKGKISTKRLKKEEIQLLEAQQSYYGTYILSGDDSMNLQIEFTSVVPFNQELQTRMKHLK